MSGGDCERSNAVTGATAPHSDEPAITVAGIVKTFGEFRAVDEVSFTVSRGAVFGLLGANGAGKSTLIRMLCGILQPTSGSATVAGLPVATHSDEIKQRIGYMSQLFSLYHDLTVRENIRLFAGIYGRFGSDEGERARWALSVAGLEGREKTRAGDLSGGYRQRLALACALLHEPAVLFLDEPTSGVDPVARRSFWDLIDSLALGGTTVLVTTHYLDEAEYCNELAMMHAGRIIAVGSPRAIKEQAPGLSAGDERRARARGSRAREAGTLRPEYRVPTLEEVFIALTERAEAQAEEKNEQAECAGRGEGAGP